MVTGRLRESLGQWLFVAALLGVAFVLGLELRTLVDRHGLWPMDAGSQTVLPPAVNARFKPPQFDPRRLVTADEKTLRQPVTFQQQPDGVLAATGSIVQGSADRLLSKLKLHNGSIHTVSFNSPGGALEDAMLIARILRARGITTVVESGAICASSCPLAFAGGRKRAAGSQAVIGLHQFYTAAKTSADPVQATADAQMTTARIVRHLESMGIDGGLWLHALETPPRALYYLNGRELRRYRLVTEPHVS